MPVYSYKCTHCGNYVELWEDVDALDWRFCKCDGLMKRQIGPTTFRWKDGSPTNSKNPV